MSLEEWMKKNGYIYADGGVVPMNSIYRLLRDNLLKEKK